MASKDESPPRFMEAKVNSIRDLADFGHRLWLLRKEGGARGRRRYFFRGQDAGFPKLTPTADRREFTDEDDQLLSDVYGVRRDLNRTLIRYRRTAHTVAQQLPDDDDWIGWMSLIQHYGGPTRLLDFTESIFVAAFFAAASVNAASNRSAGAHIWCILEQDLVQELLPVVPLILKEFPDGWPPKGASDQEFYSVVARHCLWEMHRSVGIGRRVLHYIQDPDDYIDLHGGDHFNRHGLGKLRSISGIVFARPFKLNARLLAQQGLFAVALGTGHFTFDRTSVFMEQLAPDRKTLSALSTPRDPAENEGLPVLTGDYLRLIAFERPPIVRLWLPPNFIPKLYEALGMFNITGQSLFPDFTGYTEALQHEQFNIALDDY